MLRHIALSLLKKNQAFYLHIEIWSSAVADGFLETEKMPILPKTLILHYPSLQ
jgi:hypothetical protein